MTSPVERAKMFSQSQKFLALADEAKGYGITLYVEGTKTIIKRSSKLSHSVIETDWKWDSLEDEAFILDILRRRVDIYKEQSGTNSLPASVK